MPCAFAMQKPKHLNTYKLFENAEVKNKRWEVLMVQK